MIFALVVLVLLGFSVLLNVGHLIRGLVPMRVSRDHSIGPRLEEVVKEDNDAASKLAVIEVESGWDPDADPWELYYLPDDFSQAEDLARKEQAGKKQIDRIRRSKERQNSKAQNSEFLEFWFLSFLRHSDFEFRFYGFKFVSPAYAPSPQQMPGHARISSAIRSGNSATHSS